MRTYIEYEDLSNSYAALAGVSLKYERHDDEFMHPTYVFAKGPAHSEWFPAALDSFGNVCDADGIVVYPSMSGKYPRKAGDHGYFGEFRENYGEGDRPDLPSVKDSEFPAIKPLCWF